MAKIDGYRDLYFSKGKSAAINNGSKKIKNRVDFMDFFYNRVDATESSSDKNGSQQQKMDFDEMRKKISELAKTVVDTRSKESMVAYKKEIKKFIQYVVDNAIKEKKIKARKKGLYEAENFYTIIDVIDDKLEKLSSAILDEQKKPLSILTRVNEIEGLIVDLLS